MNRINQNTIYQPEDLSSLVENVPENLQEPVTQISYNIMNHGAYNNPKYTWSVKDFELGTPLGKGR